VLKVIFHLFDPYFDLWVLRPQLGYLWMMALLSFFIPFVKMIDDKKEFEELRGKNILVE